MRSIHQMLARCCFVMLIALLPGVLTVPAAIPDPLLQEVMAMRTLVMSVSGQLEKFNSLYLGSLERKMLSTASLLANIDSNVKNLQERAHVWDTFQLHVSAWNEQIKTVDKKMDLLSREQEKFVDVDNKLTSLLGLEYKMERVMEKLESFESKLQEFGEKIDEPTDKTDSTQNTQQGTLWNEFAGIGVLSTLKNIEGKIDRLQTPAKSYKRNAGRRTYSDSDEPADPRGKFVIRCTTPPQIEEAIHDISAKVNAMHDNTCDRTAAKRSDLDYNRNGDDEEQGGARDGVWRRLVQASPSRVESCLTASDASLLRRVVDTSRELLDSGSSGSQQQREALACCRRTEQEMQTFTGSADILLKRVERVAVGLESRETRRDEASEARFREQRDHFDRMVKQLAKNVSGSSCRADNGNHKEDDNKAGSGHSGFGLQDDTEEGDTDNAEEDIDDDLRIIEVDPPPVSNSPTPISEIIPATTPYTELFTIPVTSEKSTTVSTSTTPSTTTEEEIYEPPTRTDLTTNEIFTKKEITTSIADSESTSTTTEGSLLQVVHTSCEGITGHNGIYLLGDTRDYNEAGRDFYTRHCRAAYPALEPGWTVIQSRGHGPGERLDFSRDWREYRDGFGSLDQDFWMGNEYIHRLTNEQEVTLRVELEDFEGNNAWAEYSRFRVAGERDQYALQIGGYRGNASDSFGSHHGALFSTKDRDNDEAPPCCPCAESYGGGWWFNSCFEANLNAPYYSSPHENEYFRGIIWEHWLGDYSLRATRMLVRGRGTPGYTTDASGSRLDEEPPPDDP